MATPSPLSNGDLAVAKDIVVAAPVLRMQQEQTVSCPPIRVGIESETKKTNPMNAKTKTMAIETSFLRSTTINRGDKFDLTREFTITKRLLGSSKTGL